MNKMVFFIAIGLLVLFEIFYLTSSNKALENKDLSPPAKGQAPAKEESLQEQTLQDFYLVDAKSQQKEFEVWSSKAHKDMGSTLWQMDKVKAIIYSGTSHYTVFGDKGEVDELKKSMAIEGNVRMESSNGYEFFTEKLNYEPEARQIKSDSKITMQSSAANKDKLLLEGIGLDVNLKTNDMTLLRAVQGKKPMSDNRTMKISSDQALMSGRERTMAFQNNVVIRVDQMLVRGKYARFQYKNGKLDTLFMDGGVHLRDEDKIGTSGTALVYFNEDKYVFKKKPFITQGENELIGDEIVIFNGGQRVQVKNAKMEYHQTEESAK